MASIPRPSVNVFQDFAEQPQVTSPILHSFIIGPNYHFINKTNKNDGLVGEYDRTDDNIFNYPKQKATNQIDLESIQVMFDNALLTYFDKAASISPYFRKVNTYKNRLKTVAVSPANELVFKTSINSAGTTFTRSTEFNGRDVQKNDVLYVDNGGTVTKTKVLDILPEQLPSSIAASVSGVANKGSQSHSISSAVASGGNTGDDTVATSGTYIGSLESNILNDVYTVTITEAGGNPSFVITPDGGNTGDDNSAVTASGIFDSIASDTYTVTVTTGGASTVAQITVTSVNGDSSGPTTVTFGTPVSIGTKGSKLTFTGGVDTVLTLGDIFEVAVTASSGRLQISTASGVDDVTNRVFPGFGSAFSIGTLGVLANFTDGGDTTITVGDTWTITVVKAIAAVVSTSGGDFTATTDITYTVRVTKGGLYGTAEITVTSSGLDASGPTVVTAFATPIVVGNFGVTISFATNTQGGLVLNDTFTIAATGIKNGSHKFLVLSNNLGSDILSADTATRVIAPDGGNTGNDTAAVTGTYVEEDDLLSEYVNEVYTVEIITGGAPGVAAFSVTTTSATDDDASTIVSAFGTPIAVGTRGLFITFTDGGGGVLTLGDKWYITVTKQNLHVMLFIPKKDLDIPKYRLDVPGEFAWEVTGTEVTIHDNIEVTDPAWENGLVTLPIYSAQVYIFYEAFLPYNGEVDSASTKEEIEQKLGLVDLQARLPYGVYLAMRNSTRPIKFLGLSSNDASGWDKAFALAEKYNDLYGFVILTFDKAILNKAKEHVNKVSTPSKKRWRRVFGSVDLPSQIFLQDTWTDSTETVRDFTAVVTDNPLTLDTDYNWVEASVDQGTDFLVSGVRVGDVFRYLYQTDSSNIVTYTDFTITEIINSTTLVVDPPLTFSVPVASKFTILRNMTKSDQVTFLKEYAESFADRRVQIMFPSEFLDDNNQLVPGYYLGCAVSGLLSSVQSQQGLTNFTLVGVQSVPKSSPYFTEEQLDEIAGSGLFIITQDVPSDIPFVRHQLTTNVSTISFRELSIGTNVDSVSYSFASLLSPFIGRFNITAETIDQISAVIAGEIERLRTSRDRKLGPQIILGELVSIKQDSVLRDHLRVDIRLIIPVPLNYLDVHIEVVI